MRMTNQSHEEPQQLLSPSEELARTYAEYQTTATSTSRVSERYPRPRRVSPPDSDIGYPIQETSGQPQKQRLQPQNPGRACMHVSYVPGPHLSSKFIKGRQMKYIRVNP